MLAFAGLTFTVSARADLLYSFALTPSSGPIQNFSFSFTVPAFATAGATPAFTPFNVTDGTHTWSMVQDFVGLGGCGGSFSFATVSPTGFAASAVTA